MINLDQKRVQWQAVVKTVKILWVSKFFFFLSYKRATSQDELCSMQLLVSQSMTHLVKKLQRVLVWNVDWNFVQIFQKSFTKEEVCWQSLQRNEGNCFHFPNTSSDAYSDAMQTAGRTVRNRMCYWFSFHGPHTLQGVSRLQCYIPILSWTGVSANLWLDNSICVCRSIYNYL